jgi:hypothetical protein
LEIELQEHHQPSQWSLLSYQPYIINFAPANPMLHLPIPS